MIFETHAHYEGEEFDSDRVELLSALNKKGIGKIVDVGSSMDTSRQVVELIKDYPFMYGAIGVHPDTTPEMTEEDLKELKELSKADKIVAIGEIGIDYHYTKEKDVIEKQIYWFKRQLDLALLLDLPVIVHSRDAAKDTFDILSEYHKKGLRAVLHCYSYSADQAKEYVKMGYYIGLGGAITFKNASKKREVVESIPLSSMLTETDCPYMAPVPVRGTRNHSGNLIYVVDKIAKLKGITKEEVEDITYNNSMKFYNLAN